MPVIISGSTGISGTDGSAGTPAVQGTDGNTGMFFPAADQIAFAEGGVEAMRLDASGNLGLGTTTPGTGIANRVFAINGTDTGIHFLTSGADTNRIYSSSGEFRLQTATAIPLVFYTDNTERARITSGGILCIGTTSTLPGYLNNLLGVALQGDGTASFSKAGNITTVINNNGSGQSLTQYNYQGNYVGQVILNGTTGVLYQTASDYRLKQNVQPLTGGLATIAALKPSTYRWKADNSYGEGFLAHELAAHIPQAVSGEKDAVNEDGSIKAQSVDYSRIVVHLVSAVQELKSEIAALKARVAALEAR